MQEQKYDIFTCVLELNALQKASHFSPQGTSSAASYASKPTHPPYSVGVPSSHSQHSNSVVVSQVSCFHAPHCSPWPTPWFAHEPNGHFPSLIFYHFEILVIIYDM